MHKVPEAIVQILSCQRQISLEELHRLPLPGNTANQNRAGFRIDIQDAASHEVLPVEVILIFIHGQADHEIGDGEIRVLGEIQRVVQHIQRRPVGNSDEAIVFHTCHGPHFADWGASLAYPHQQIVGTFQCQRDRSTLIDVLIEEHPRLAIAARCAGERADHGDTRRGISQADQCELGIGTIRIAEHDDAVDIILLHLIAPRPGCWHLADVQRREHGSR